MSTLKTISDKQRDYLQYCKRQDSIRVHMTDLADREKVKADYKEAQEQLFVIQAKVDEAETKANEAETKANEAEAKVGEIQAIANAKVDAAQLEIEQLRAKLKAAKIAP